MTELEQYRKEIDQIDQELTRLVEERFEVAKKVASYKIDHGLPVLDVSREELVIGRNQKRLKNQEYLEDLTDFFAALMAISRRIQEKRIKE